MSAGKEWEKISERIRAFEVGADYYVRTGPLNNGKDGHNVGSKAIIPEAQRIYQEIREFSVAYKDGLEEPIKVWLDDFIQNFDKPFTAELADHNQLAKALITLLPIARGFLDFSFSDREIQVRHNVERAFLHLKRSLIVDSDLRSRWAEAFANETKDKGVPEVKCEALGAVHLLAHGIWSFKASGPRSATDLVLGGKVENESEAARAGASLVLTEWKLARNRKKVDEKLGEAFRQARDYGEGIFGGIELKKTRYLVVVTEKEEPVGKDQQDDGILYRKVNIPISPNRSSERARKVTE